ncbi:MAG TPA: hypothetical protein VKU92_12240 [Acidimicrobiales bacterium]|nr:hypothetical protein [Acidimicrobiales bacterium]
MSVLQDTTTPVPIPVEIGGVRAGPPRSRVLRRDAWWFWPAVQAFGLLCFIGYGVWTAFRGDFYYATVAAHAANGNAGRHYLSPFYSPCFVSSCPTAAVWGPAGGIGTVSPALLILIFPMGFRVTCYYYRKTYYRAFWASPPACAVADAGSTTPGGIRSRYTGETRFPLVLQNVHRYFWYVAVIFAGILTWDAIESFRFGTGWGMGLGSLIFVVNAVLIWAYTAGCHACRHLCGGGLRKFSDHPVRHAIWQRIVTPLNTRHQLFAWLSLIWIAWTDLYVYLVSTGNLHDPRFF